ncbi:MAG TPA: MucR family transcriptional regulator [Caulobacteraceae bacterium]|nr:MucR family transcriptional regulator [Caulobacteraceae bacterium]
MPTANALQLTAGIVSRFVQRNEIGANDLPALIQGVHQATAGAGHEDVNATEESRKATPAQIRRSMQSEVLISFEDGKPYRLLKRHLRTLGLTPEQYRAKWGLPADYPMTAPAYAEKRSQVAKAAGLGRTTRGPSRGGRSSSS